MAVIGCTMSSLTDIVYAFSMLLLWSVFGLGFRLWCLASREVPLLSWVMVLTCILGGGDVKCEKGKFVFVGCVSCSCCWCCCCCCLVVLMCVEGGEYPIEGEVLLIFLKIISSMYLLKLLFSCLVALFLYFCFRLNNLYRCVIVLILLSYTYSKSFSCKNCWIRN